MGVGSSTFVEINRHGESGNLVNLRAVSKFLLKAYSICSPDEAVLLLLSNDTGLKHFSNFVGSHNETEYLDLFMELNGMKSMSNPTVHALQQQMQRIAEEYIRADSRRYMVIPSYLIRDIEGMLSPEVHSQPQPVTHVLEVIEQLRQEMVARVARDQFPSFLSSKYFQNWQAIERGLATESAQAMMDASNVDTREATTDMNERSVSFVEDPTLTACVLKVNVALNSVLHNTAWLSALLSAVEVLPISFLLCQAANGDVEKGDIPRFPVLYANKFVEKLFGFSRGEFIGNPFDALLRCAETEAEIGSIAAQLEALTQQNQVTSAVLTHANSKGVPFKNLVATKPIFDPSGACVYIIYLMFPQPDSIGCSSTDTASTSTGQQNNAVSTTTTVGAHQNSPVFTSVDRLAQERTKAEKLLRLLPKYITSEAVLEKEHQQDEENVVQPTASAGVFGRMLDQRRPFRLFYNSVLPAGSEGPASSRAHPSAPASASAPAQQEQAMRPLGQQGQQLPDEQQQVERQQGEQGRVLSVRQAQLSGGPDSRLGGAAPVVVVQESTSFCCP